MDHRFSLVQGKFIETPAQIHVICLASHWSLGDISLPLQSVQLDKRAAGLSNLQQPGTGSLPSYIFQMKFKISIKNFPQYGQGGFSFSLANADLRRFGASQGKTKPQIWQTVMGVLLQTVLLSPRKWACRMM